MHRRRLAAVAGMTAVAAVTALTLAPNSGAAPAATHSGTISFYSVSENNGKTLDIVTGAITDHGSDRSVGEKYQKIVLSKGSFEVDSEKFNKSFTFKEDKKGCSATGTGSGTNLAISNGTGAYAGISGSINVKATFTLLGVVKNGVCQNLEHHESYSVSSFLGTGHVSY